MCLENKLEQRNLFKFCIDLPAPKSLFGNLQKYFAVSARGEDLTKNRNNKKDLEASVNANWSSHVFVIDACFDDGPEYK